MALKIMENMNISVQVRPYAEMRYPTVGDYYYLSNGTLQFDIAETGSPIYNKLILIHELVEWALIEHRRLPIPTIDSFDWMFGEQQRLGLRAAHEEPGFAHDSPYQREHTMATGIEMAVCVAAGIKWSDYEQALTELTCPKT